MLAYQNDTIAALATPPGRGGIAIVRVSGENARAYFEALFRPAGRQRVESHRLLYGHLYDADGAMLDECMAVLMRLRAPIRARMWRSFICTAAIRLPAKRWRRCIAWARARPSRGSLPAVPS